MSAVSHSAKYGFVLALGLFALGCGRVGFEADGLGEGGWASLTSGATPAEDEQGGVSLVPPKPEGQPEYDACPTDVAKSAPGTCGCGVVDLDTDQDGTMDCHDGCPTDPAKTDPGLCGCGMPDRDSDADDAVDCQDRCPADPDKLFPGLCGCGVPDVDADSDGIVDCEEQCPSDREKLQPGLCGCDVPDTDVDGDGTVDCQDGCPDDSGKLGPGICGCGVVDVDSDADGAYDCLEECPHDPNKVDGGICGCGTADVDSDGDGTPNCIDLCVIDSGKTAPGACGCGAPDLDLDGSGVADCLEQPQTSVVFAEDFQSGLGRWSADGNWRATRPDEEQVPGAASNNRVAQSYDCDDCGILSPVLPTAGAVSLTITLNRYLDEAMDDDYWTEYLELWVLSNSEWSRIKKWRAGHHDDDTWHHEEFDLTQYASDDLRVGFYMYTNSSYETVEVDDVVVTMTR